MGVRREVWLAGFAGVLALGVYLLTLAPTITWRHGGADSGELAVAAATLGVAHPPGYPTWTLLAWLFHWLPVGELAQRIALLSALSAAFAVGTITWLADRLLRQGGMAAPGVAVVAGLTFAFGPALWSQAILVEVYALHTLFVLALLALSLWPAPNPVLARRRAGLMAFLFGLGLGNHLTLLLLAPLLLVVLPRPLTVRRVGSVLLCLLAGLAVYLYLPLAAFGRPPILWGDPSTKEGFVWLVSGQLYRGALFGLDWVDLPARVVSWSQLLAQQLTWPGLLLVAAGAWSLSGPRTLRGAFSTTWVPAPPGGAAHPAASHFQDRARVGAILLWVFAATTVYALTYATIDWYVHLLPAYVVMTLWLAQGMQVVVNSVVVRWPGWHRVSWLLWLLPVVLLVRSAPAVSLRDDVTARDYALHALAVVAPGAMIVSSGDEHTFALWYARHGLGVRPDVTVVERTLWSFDWYRQHLAASPVALPAAAGPEIETLIETQLPQRPVYVTDPEEDLALRYVLAPAGPLWQITGH